ncbi:MULTISPECIES: D-alanyl-D-alanine carboxypeptidase family protein [Halomonadaceae]|nr:MULTISPECIES: D-alanyl-D-alanine carboxypeptidase family protein [Halomonas]MDI4636159.1 D-alanyl-D-alanine carboxypeptidase [Halomonas sp. BMC7]NUJ60525.1 D-alanyl-D-alanine carboxypeptidase [Halomonas taeanensis]
MSALLLCLLCFALPLQAQEVDSPQPQTLIPSPPSLAASSWLLMDADTGKVLVSHNADERLPPASLTKLMTAYLVEHELSRGNIDRDDQVLVSEKAWRTGGSRMFIQEGSQVSVDQLLQGVIIQSGNDASVALAEHIAGGESAFADLMNQQADRMGMVNTHFANATGLPHENHYSSAHDLALLARHIINDYPEQYKVYAEKEYTYNDIRQPNRNRLLWRDSSVDGLKTGHTEAAGYCLVASAKRDDMRLISVVMGTDSDEARAQESQKLLSYGFRFYETMELYPQGAVLASPRIWGGEKNNLRLGVDREVRMTVPRGRGEELAARLNLPASIEAPVEAGARLGTLEIKLGDEVIGERPLVALESIDQGGIFKRLLDSVRRFISGLFD